MAFTIWQSLFAIAMHLAGSILLAVSFVKVASVVFCLSKNLRITPKFFSGTKLPLRTNLIILGSSGFLFLGMSFIYAILTPTSNPPGYVRFIGTTFAIVGNILMIYALYDFYRELKAKGVAKA
ncbi:MAG: hypothetical protein NUV67_04750 [archaeon]|nr:hypothetical protein [archaeon]